MKKLFTAIFGMALLLLTTSLVLTSCSKDDEEQGYSIVGKWKTTWDDGYGLLTLQKNGTGTYLEYAEGYDVDQTDILYEYMESEGLLKLSFLDGTEIDETIVFPLQWRDKNTFVTKIDDELIWVRQ